MSLPVLRLAVEAVADATARRPGLGPWRPAEYQVIDIEWMAGKSGRVAFWLRETIHVGGLPGVFFR